MSRLAIDIGGTFTDLILFNENTGELKSFKSLSTPRDPSQGVVNTIDLSNIKKNDIIYWKGHVAVAVNNKKLIHAYGPMKKTIIMGIDQTIKKINKTANLKVIGIKRL